MEDVEDFFWRKPTEYRSYYHMKINGYVDLTCCIIVLVSNTFVIMVLTKKSINSPFNTIFTHLAITESLAALSYVPRFWHEYFRVELCGISQHRTYIWEMISLKSYEFAATFRHIAAWMGLMLAIWRYIAIIYPLKERDWCNTQITRIGIATGYIAVTVSTIPAIFCMTVGPAVKLFDQNGCLTTNLTVTIELIAQILPSIGMSFISFKLIVSLNKVGEHRKEMVTTSNRNNTYNFQMKQQIKQQTDRTNKLLLMILILFIIGEAPHGIYSMINAYYGPKFFWKYYLYAMETFNSLTYVSGSFNFVIYYSMNYQFRKTFKELFNGNSNNNTPTPQQSSSSLPGVKKLQENSSRSSSITTVSSTCT